MLIADVSEPSTSSIFIGRWMKYIHINFIHLSMKMELIRGFRKVGYEPCDAGELPKRKHITYRTR